MTDKLLSEINDVLENIDIDLDIKSWEIISKDKSAIQLSSYFNGSMFGDTHIEVFLEESNNPIDVIKEIRFIKERLDQVEGIKVLEVVFKMKYKHESIGTFCTKDFKDLTPIDSIDFCPGYWIHHTIIDLKIKK